MCRRYCYLVIDDVIQARGVHRFNSARASAASASAARASAASASAYANP
jgi:hypothetical protein